MARNDVDRLLSALSEDDQYARRVADRAIRDNDSIRFFKGVVLGCLISLGFWGLLGWFLLSH